MLLTLAALSFAQPAPPEGLPVAAEMHQRFQVVMRIGVFILPSSSPRPRSRST